MAFIQTFGFLVGSSGASSDMNTISPVFGYSLIALVLAVLAFLFYVLYQFKNYQQKIKDGEERLQLSLWASGDELWDWNIELGHLIRTNSSGIYNLPEIEPDMFPPNKHEIHPNDIKRVGDVLVDHLRGNSESFECAYRLKNAEQGWSWVLDKGKVVSRDADGTPLRMTGTFKDIHYLKKTENELKIFARSIKSIAEGVVIFDNSLRVLHINPGFCQITGLEQDSVIGQRFEYKHIGMSKVQEIKSQVDLTGHWQGDITGQRTNGRQYLAQVTVNSILDSDGKITNYVAIVSDTTKRKKAEAKLVKIASIDTLTNLQNRSVFFAKLQKCVNQKLSTAVLVFDLDDFKKINDSLSHQIGDELLIEIAKRIDAIMESGCSLFRLGGDEFAVIMENTNDIHQITLMAKRILTQLTTPFTINQYEFVIAGSLGIVLYPDDGQQPETLLKNADTAMYHAKEAGNSYLFYNEDMNRKAVKRLQVENLIRHGLKDDYFQVYYQPKIDVASGSIVGMEALVRFITPKKGLISPGVFVPIAEETGQIVEIGNLVLRKACQDMKRWVDQGKLKGRVAVNLSAKQFTRPNLLETIDSILEKTGLPPQYLELEITEGTVMDNPKHAITIMHKLRMKGIHLAMDDFGTGYSSLSYLAKFPLNTLKIDRAFVEDSNSKVGKAMVDTIVTIAKNLGLSTVAEGVETEQQHKLMEEMKCDVLQGYLFAKPLAVEDFEAYLNQHKS